MEPGVGDTMPTRIGSNPPALRIRTGSPWQGSDPTSKRRGPGPVPKPYVLRTGIRIRVVGGIQSSSIDRTDVEFPGRVAEELNDPRELRRDPLSPKLRWAMCQGH